MKYEMQGRKTATGFEYRIVSGGVTSPDFRSKNAARVFLHTGMEALLKALAEATHAATKRAKEINEMSDFEIENLLDEKEPPNLLRTISQ